MKNLKKIIVAASLCAAIGATAIAGTLAYFTSETEVKTNTFTAGDLDITLTEPKWDETVGESFEIIPGISVDKDPTVTLANGSVDSYVRLVVNMPVNVYNMSNLKSGSGDDIVVFYNGDNVLGPKDIAKTRDDGTVDIYFDTTMTAGETFCPFNKIAFSGKGITNAEKEEGVMNDIYAALEDLKINVNAYAVQKYSFEEEGADYAFGAAFPTVFGTVTGD